MTMQQLLTALEWASLLLTVALGLTQLGLSVWKYIDHGHPDARREWIQRAVELAIHASGQAESLLGVGAESYIERKVCFDLAHRAETYLLDHGLRFSLRAETVQMVISELRQLEGSGPVGFQPTVKK